jgi:hypothetical protein
MNIEKFKNIINELHDKSLVNKYELDSEASNSYYKKNNFR